MSNTTEAPFFTLDAYRSQWALHDDQIAYVEDDDIPYDLAGVLTFWVVMMVVIFSGCIGALIFFVSYGQERLGWFCCWTDEGYVEGEKCFVR